MSFDLADENDEVATQPSKIAQNRTISTYLNQRIEGIFLVVLDQFFQLCIKPFLCLL